jgi:hypothetical protein
MGQPMTATIHTFTTSDLGWRDRLHDAEMTCIKLAARLQLERISSHVFAQQIAEYANRNGDALLSQMAREYMEGIGK